MLYILCVNSSGAAQQAIKEVKDLEKMITEEPERLTMINLLFIISSCSRFGELLVKFLQKLENLRASSRY